MKKNRLRKNFLKASKKSAFSFVEILAALTISSISIVVIVKISLQMTQLALENDASDTATQIASKTSEELVRLTKGDSSSTIPYLYTLCGNQGTDTKDQNYNFTPNNYTSDNYDSTKFLPMYLEKDSLRFETLFHNFSQSNPYISKKVPALSTSSSDYTVTFSKDEFLDQKDIFYRFIGLEYNPTYKIMVGQVIIYWQMYGKDNFYISYPSFSMKGLC